MAYLINEDKCVGCGACAYICLLGIPVPTDSGKQKYYIDSEGCLGCGQCIDICPNNAISPAPGHRRIISVTIDRDRCIGCSLCARACVTKAPQGKIKEPFTIDQSKCIKCGLCATKCKKDAIIVTYEE